MSRRSPKSDRSFGTRASGKSGRERVSRGQLIRDRYSTDRYPTAEEFIKAVERNPEYFDPSSESFFPHDYGQGFAHSDKPGLRGVSGTNLKGNRPNRSNWIADNPIEVDASSDPGSVSVSVEAWNNDQGDSIDIVAGVDLMPMGIDINVNGDVGTIAVDLGMPGDAIGVTVGASFDTETGEVIGGQLGLAGGGLSVNVNQIRKNGETCSSITVTYFGIGASYQRCKKDDEDDEKDPPKEPPPGPGEEPEPQPPSPMPPPQIPGDPSRVCIVAVCWIGTSFEYYKYTDTPGNPDCKGLMFSNITKRTATVNINYPMITVYLNNNQIVKNKTGVIREEILEGTAIYALIGGGSLYGVRWAPNTEILNQTGNVTAAVTEMLNGTVAECNNFLKNTAYFFSYNSTNDRGDSCNHSGNITLSYTSVISVYYPDTGETWNPPPEGPTPPKEPEPPIPPEDDMTNCCDLEPVMSLLRKVSTAIGTDQLPAMMPRSFLKNEGFRKIPSLAELAVYHVEIMDQLIGKFPIELEIKDTDPLSAGDQTKKVVLTNLAESVAELFGLAINSASDNAIQTSGSIKNLLEITLVRQAVLQNYYRLDAILDYLGAGLEEDTTTFNSTISLPKDPNNISEDVADFLQQSEIKFAYDKLANPKDTLTAKLLPIQKAADIIKAKYWKGFGKAGGDYLGAIKSWLKTYDPKNEQNDTEWKDKIDKILEEYAKDATGNIDKDRMPVIQNVTQIGSEPKPPGA